MQVDRLADGLWRWTAGDAACIYHEAPDGIVLIDPLVPDDEAERFWRHLDADVERVGHPPTVLVTLPDARSAEAVRDRYPGARVVPAADGEGLPGGVAVEGGAVTCPCHGLLWRDGRPA